MMGMLRIALLQISPLGSAEKNMQKGITWCRKASQEGAELILVPNACPMEINRLSQLRARAFENMTAIATCNYPGSVPDCNGNSTVFDGMAYLPGEGGSRDTCILRSGEQEGIYICELDLAMLRDYRKNEVFGNAYRHPEKYGLLTKAK